MTLLRFTVSLIRNNFPEVNDFTDELIYLNKASSGKMIGCQENFVVHYELCLRW